MAIFPCSIGDARGLNGTCSECSFQGWKPQVMKGCFNFPKVVCWSRYQWCHVHPFFWASFPDEQVVKHSTLLSATIYLDEKLWQWRGVLEYEIQLAHIPSGNVKHQQLHFLFQTLTWVFGLPITLLYFRVSLMFPKINGNGKHLTYLSVLCSIVNLHMLDFPIPPTPKNKKQQGHHKKPRNHLIWQEPLKKTTVPFPFKGISFSLHKGASHLHEAADRRTMPRACMARPKVSAL